MKVIFLKDVPKVGKKFDIKEMSDGYALNFLIPRNLAKIANAGNMKSVEMMKAKEAEEKEKSEEKLAESLRKAQDVTVEIKAKANEKGHLWSGIHKEELAKAIKEQSHLDIPAEYIVLDQPIKEVGFREIEISVSGKTAKIKVKVFAEKE